MIPSLPIGADTTRPDLGCNKINGIDRTVFQFLGHTNIVSYGLSSRECAYRWFAQQYAIHWRNFLWNPIPLHVEIGFGQSIGPFDVCG